MATFTLEMGEDFIEDEISRISLEDNIQKIMITDKISKLNTKNSIIWNSSESFGIVNSPKGSFWNTIGVINSGQAKVFADEALYLVELFEFNLFISSEVSDNCSKLETISELLTLIKKDCGFTSYKVIFLNLNSTF